MLTSKVNSQTNKMLGCNDLEQICYTLSEELLSDSIHWLGDLEVDSSIFYFQKKEFMPTIFYCYDVNATNCSSPLENIYGDKKRVVIYSLTDLFSDGIPLWFDTEIVMEKKNMTILLTPQVVSTRLNGYGFYYKVKMSLKDYEVLSVKKKKKKKKN